MASLVAQMVKNPLAMKETWVQPLSWEDNPEKGMATHSSILAWRIPWTELPGRLQPLGSQRAGYDWVTNTFTFTFFPKDGYEFVKYQVGQKVCLGFSVPLYGKTRKIFFFFFLPIQYMSGRNLFKTDLMVSIRLIEAHGIFSSTPGSWKFSGKFTKGQF